MRVVSPTETGKRVRNVDERTVRAFGDEWTRFDQSGLTEQEKLDIFTKYFSVFPFSDRSAQWEGFDLGCGSGRWASLVAPRVRKLNLIEPSASALAVARRNLGALANCEYHHCPVDDMPLGDNTQDFGYALGVLHHVPDTAEAMASCVRKLKEGSPFLVYLYYDLDARPSWYRGLWRLTEVVRPVIAAMPSWLRYQVCQVIAAAVYWPLARVAHLGRLAGFDIRNWPLSFYENRSFYVMRNDALDRFGTPLEQRFTRAQVEEMMVRAGLERISFSDEAPFWCAIGYKKPLK